MLNFDRYNDIQKNFECLETVCKVWMLYYNSLINQIGNTEVDEFFYREHFNEVKWYDV